MEALENVFGERIISRNHWAPRSPDFTPCDYFLWGFLKSKVFHNTLKQLRNNITQQITDIPTEMLQKVFGNLFRRYQLCLTANGSQFQHML